MDPCPFIRIIIGGLALKIPVAEKSAGAGVHPSMSSCFCRIRLKNFPSQTTTIPLVSDDSSPPDSGDLAAGFHLDTADLRRLSGRKWLAGKAHLTVEVYTGRSGATCGVSSGRLLGHVCVELDLKGTESRTCVFQKGWVKIVKNKDKDSKPPSRLHLVVRAEPDPRFVFQFGGEPECSPVVFQIQGNIRQPVFSCKFSPGRNSRSRSSKLKSDPSNTKGWLGTFGSEREQPTKERKGWMIMVHDLSGSPVAAASMVTPFVASPGTDRVSRSNPGAWLILWPHGSSREGVSNWKPWGRLEAWRERGSGEALGYRFKLMTNAGANSGVLVAESTLSIKKGGRFAIDSRMISRNLVNSPAGCPRSGGFVMDSTVEGEGKVSKPMVQVGLRHVTCMADAAVFVALSAAVDLSVDACRLFSHKLRKELCQDEQDCIS